MVPLNSSLRTRPIAETLVHARRLGRELGVVRVTDTTRLDRLGVPVYASIRPDASPRSLCVSAGKGLIPAEAEVGAWMEAIELALAEPGRAGLPVRACTPAELRASSGLDLVDFCPRADLALDQIATIPCVTATDLDRDAEVLAPAGCVFFPIDGAVFWSSTNGLASGNSLAEATIHGLAEVLERDVRTFQRLRNTSRLVRNETLPAPLAAIAERTARLGLRLIVRAALGDARIPYFHAIVHEPGAREGLQEGWGCHPWASIAATRAVCEAFQCRLSLIHGGRDDLAGQKERLGAISDEARDASLEKAAVFHGSDAAPIDFGETGDHSAEAPTLDEVYRVLREGVRALGAGAPLRVTLTPPESPLAVVKVIVPRLENWSAHLDARMGPRLARALGRTR